MVRKRLVWVGAIALLVVAGAAAVGGAQEPEYVDDDGSVHEGSLRLLQQVGVLAGLECGPAAICPKDPIDRTMMAVWLIRARDHALLADQEQGRAEWEPHPGLEDLSGYFYLSNRFADLGTLSFRSWPYPGRLYSEGISAGCRTDPLRYCPDSPVTRAQMASFLVRAFDLEEAPAAGFADVDERSVHAGAIDALAASGITAGCSADPLLFCPNNQVTRGQMASFLGPGDEPLVPPGRLPSSSTARTSPPAETLRYSTTDTRPMETSPTSTTANTLASPVKTTRELGTSART